MDDPPRVTILRTDEFFTFKNGLNATDGTKPLKYRAEKTGLKAK